MASLSIKEVTVVSTNGLRDSSINTQSAINRHINNISYNLNYSASLDKAGNSAITADADYSNYQRRSAENLQNEFFSMPPAWPKVIRFLTWEIHPSILPSIRRTRFQANSFKINAL